MYLVYYKSVILKIYDISFVVHIFRVDLLEVVQNKLILNKLLQTLNSETQKVQKLHSDFWKSCFL